jgi:hypothetical protein
VDRISVMFANPASFGKVFAPLNRPSRIICAGDADLKSRAMPIFWLFYRFRI